MHGDLFAYTRDFGQDPIENVRQNLGELDERQETLSRARAFWLGELTADQAPDALPEADDVQALFEQLTDGDGERDAYAVAMQYADALTLCREIAARCPTLYERAFAELFGTHVPLSSEAQGRVAYVANNYTEQAFMELTGFIKGRRVAYFHSFEDVCQEVHSGLCEYGILPVESTADGAMAGLLRLVELYDLRICALCYVPTAQSGSTAFALVRATLPVKQPTAGHCLDLLLSPAAPEDTGALILTASLCSHTLLHASTYTGQDAEQFRLRIAAEPSTLYPFLLYLLLFCRDITPIGYYSIK